jgi:hypothetical protein
VKCVSQKDLARYLEGEVTRSRAEEVEEHLHGCDACRRELESMREMVGRLSKSAGPEEHRDHLPEVRRRIESGYGAYRRRRRRWSLAAVTGAALIALAVAGWFLLRPADRADEFRTKSAQPPIPEQDRWAGIQAFRVDAAGAAVGLGDGIRKSDYLVFSYTNLGEQPYGYMMIFAVDGRGRVYWLHPAYLRAGDDPVSIGISKDAEGVELREKIRHEYPEGRLWIYGLFTNEALKASSIEMLVKSTPRGERIPLDGSAQHILVTEVKP